MNWSLISTFLAMGFAVLMMSGDFAAINVSLSALNSTSLWVINAYIIAFSMFLIPAGRLGDLFGRKRLFLYGLVLFALMSFLGAVTKSDNWLVVARFLQGSGAALMWPSIVGICYNAVPEEKRSFTIGLLLGAVGIGIAIGLVVGDFFTQGIGWRAVLWINLPLSLLSGLLAYYKLDAEATTEGVKFDYPGAASLSSAIFVLMYAVQHSHIFGFYSKGLWMLVALAVAFLVLFFLFQFKKACSLIPTYILKSKLFIVTSLTVALISPAFFATLLYLPQFMQKFLGFTIHEAGIGLTPMLLIWAFVSPVAGDLSHYIGIKMIAFIATLSIAVGTFLLGFVGPQTDYYFLLPGMIIAGLGYGFGFSTLTTAAVSSADNKDSSTAAGAVYLFFVLGGALGLALAYGIFYLFAENHLGAFINHSYMRGYFFTMLITALLAVVAALLALICMKRNVKAS